MQVLVTLVSSHKRLRRVFIQNQNQILTGDFLPKDLRGRVSFVACEFDPNGNPESLHTFLLAQLINAKADAVAVLLDERWQREANHINNAVFIGTVHFPEYMQNVQNILSVYSAKLLRNLGHLLLQLSDSTVFQAAVLPLRNFQAQELQELARICKEQAMEGNFSNEVQMPLKELITRRGPKRRSDYPTRYFRDDLNNFFEYGHEEHARFDTGGDHSTACHINGLFRFGKRLEESRHFNVTQSTPNDDRISAEFLNCHDVKQQIVRRTHVNMFSNDFHK